MNQEPLVGQRKSMYNIFPARAIIPLFVAIAVGTFGMVVTRTSVEENPASAQGSVPDGTLLGRTTNNKAEILLFEAGNWLAIVPESDIPDWNFGQNIQVEESIQSIVAAPGRLHIAFRINYCQIPSGNIELMNPCYGVTYYYDATTSQITQLKSDDSAAANKQMPVVPKKWIVTDEELLVTIPTEGVIANYDVQSHDFTQYVASGMDEPSLGDYDSISSDLRAIFDGEHSGGTGHAIWDLNTGTVLSLASSGTDTSNMFKAFSPDEEQVAVVSSSLSTAGDQSSEILIHDSATGALVDTVPMGTSTDDGSPKWVSDSQIVFVRSESNASWANGGINRPGVLMSYDLNTQTVSTVVTGTEKYSSIISPVSSNKVLFVRGTGTSRKAYFVSAAGGSPAVVLSDSSLHTAIAWAPSN